MKWTCPYPETRCDLMGIPVYRLDRAQLLHCFQSALATPDSKHFAYLNIAVSNQAADNPQLAEQLNQSDLVYVDGAGIALGCRLLNRPSPPRNTGADFLPALLEQCARDNCSVGLLGGTPGTAQKVVDRYQAVYPNLKVKLVCDGFDQLQDKTFWQPQLQHDPPELLMVGLGVPRQEEWIARYRMDFPIRLYWSVGALFEYDGGGLARCPRWMGTWGLEWMFRLAMEPKRLWKRYLIGNPRFLLRCLCSRCKARVGMR